MKKPKNDFVHLHVHSDMSQLDGCGKIANYVEKAKSMGHSAIAFTEHGTMRQYYTQLEECESRGLKPIYGIEFYVSGNMRRKGLTEEEKKSITSGLKKSEHKSALKRHEEREGIRDRWHLTVLAKNEVGLKNLFKLSTNAWLEGFYYKPRIDLDELIKYKDGLIVATGCQSSVINDHVCVGKRKKALNIADRLYNEFGSELWLEVMPHEGEDQVLSNKFAMELMERWDKRVGMVATQDAHYVDKTDMDAHEVLLCIGTRDNMSNPDRFRFGDGELYLKSRKEMFSSFMKYHSYMGSKLIKRSLNSTLDVADEIQNKIIKIDRFACLMPTVDVPDKFGGDEYSYTKALCIHGWTWREIPKRASFYAKKYGMSYDDAIGIYKHRLKHELGSIKRQKFITYFLLVRDLYNWARKQDIMCGPGRGSAAGSLVAFLLGITSVDPIEHGLLFERFINPARVDMPDIDMDFEDVRRQEIIEYLRQKYGGDRVSQIATIGKLSGKQCLKDISRVLEVPYVEVNQVTNSIIERSSGDERASQTIEDSFRDFKICREFNKKYPDVLKYAKILEGMNKNLGIHAAGVVTSPVPLVEVVPLEVRKHKEGDVIVTAVDMNGAQAHGLLKLDVLGLRTLAILKDTLRAVKENTGEEIDLERLTLDDKKVLQAFTDHDYVGIFQYDSPGADKICNGVEFDDFTDVAAMTALNRPGTARSGLATEYVERKKHPEKRKVGHFHPKVSEITSDTMGVIVYQEHVQKIFVEIAGFPPGTADSLRKKIAKKYGDETIGKERENFIRGAREHSGIDEKTAGKIMDAITFFGCLEYDTKIYTPGGWKEIYKLKEGDSIYSCDGGEIIENTIKAIGCSGTKPVFNIETDNGSVNASENHWWRLENGEYVKTKELCLGNSLSYPMNIKSVGGKNEVQNNRRKTKKSVVRSLNYVGQTITWDLQCSMEPANYITTIGVVHNSYGFNKSHATSYGIIAYWGMWLKVYYPLEFYWALLKNTPDRIRIQGFAKDAKRHGIELLPPDVSVSRREFAIDRSRNAIRGSLVDIKNVGEKAADSIMDNQPYKDYIDFISRIDRRRVNKRVLVSLAKSGSLDGLVPNVKWYIENIDKLNIDVDKKHVVNDLLDKFEKSKKLENYSEEERQLVSSQVNPLAFGKHPIDAYEDFIKNNVKVTLYKMSDEDFWDNYDGENIFIYGVIIEVKYNRIGDFHSGELPPEEEREMMFWGQRYANVNVEDSGGSQNRVKFDIDIFDDMRELIDTGIGTPVVIHATPNKKYENLNANFAVDLERYRKKIINGEKLNVWENIIYGNHPALTKNWKSTSRFDREQIKIQRVKNELFFKGKTKKFTGVVIRRRLKYDKNGHLMSFFNMMDAECNSINCICFASSWNKEVENAIKYGNFLSIELDRQVDIRNKGNWQYFFNGGGIKWYKKSSDARYTR
jgi:DNA-directed DNA polymerase III PolC